MTSLPDKTTERLREAYTELQRAQQRWEELYNTAIEMADVDEDAQIDLEHGVIHENGLHEDHAA